MEYCLDFQGKSAFLGNIAWISRENQPFYGILPGLPGKISLFRKYCLDFLDQLSVTGNIC
jgi:hypothetical protein